MDEIIVAHMVGGVDTFVKMSHGWPVSNHALKLISLKSSDYSPKEISLSFLCKVEVSCIVHLVLALNEQKCSCSFKSDFSNDTS